MVMKSRGPVRGSFGMSERRRAAEQSDAEREAAMTPEQHDRVAAYHREQVRLFPGIADLHNADAARHEAEARRKREFVGRPQETRIGATSRAASGPAAEAMHTPMAEETRRMGLPTMRDSMDAVRAAERARGGTPRTLGVTGASGESARRAVAAGDASREAARRSSLNSHQGAAASHEAAAAAYKAEGNHARAQHHADTAARHRMAVREFSRSVPTHSPAAAPAGSTRAMHVTQHGTATAHTPHDQAMHQATQTGAKGGKFVISATGKKRYVKR